MKYLHTMVRVRDIDGTARIEVETNKIDLLKIDTEGYEFKIIKGLGESISKIKLIH